MTRDESFDMDWLLTHGTGMAWQYALFVQPSLHDIEAAYDDGNWPVCVEACAAALRALAYCDLVGAGYVGPPSDAEHHLWLAVSDNDAARTLRGLPLPIGVSRREADTARADVLRVNEDVQGRLPMEMPVLRTFRGYAPALRVITVIDRLRARRGMGPLDWRQWGI